MKTTLFLFLLFATTPLIANHSLVMQQVAERIVGDLYEVVGDHVMRKPDIEISTKQDAGARFEASRNTIILEEKLYHICTNFGKDSLSALAFVLGHELGHFYDRKNGASYLAHHHHVEADIEDEYTADVHGVFNAYLAGYKTVSIIPDLIDSIYENYNLKGKKLHGYPDLAERKATAQFVLEEVEKLIHAFELGNYLSVMGEYKYATATYEFILKQYKGREIHNNLGVVYLLEALNFTEKTYHTYLYPVEIDIHTRLKKPNVGRGEKDLDPEQKRYQIKLLNKAVEQFDKAARLDPNYIIDDINKVCALLLLGHVKRANFHYQNKLENRIVLLTNNTEYGNILLVKALLHLAQGETADASAIWTQLQSDNNKIIALQASYNLSVLHQDCRQKKLMSEDCPESVLPSQIIDGINLNTFVGNDAFTLNDKIRLSIDLQAQSIVYELEDSDGYHLVFQRVHTSKGARINSKTPLLSVSTQAGFYLHCPNHNTVSLLDATSRIVEWGQIFVVQSP